MNLLTEHRRPLHRFERQGKNMRIGILVTMMNNFGKKGMYHSQEAGIAGALSRLGHSVIIYKYLPRGEPLPEREQKGNVVVEYRWARAVGINGLITTACLDCGLDALFMFADTQLCVPAVYRWCRKHSVTFLPYIGVVKSHSPSRIRAFLINTLFRRNLAVYRNCACLAKNPAVRAALEGLGVTRAVFAPVGINPEALYSRFREASPAALREAYGYASDDQVILFVGRLEPEKRPLELLTLFRQLHAQDSRFRLLLVGTGSLYPGVIRERDGLGLTDSVKILESVPNARIWELFRLCSCFVNLNRSEIFGMALLEAMYYETKVVAWHAPGPDCIIENGVSGYLVSTDREFLAAVLEGTAEVAQAAHRRIAEGFTWDKTARLIEEAAALSHE